MLLQFVNLFPYTKCKKNFFEKVCSKICNQLLRLQVHSREEKRRYKFLQDLVISIFSTQILSKDIFFCKLKVGISCKWNHIHFEMQKRIGAILE